MMRGIEKRLKRSLYLSHRWLGIATSLLFVMWFLSGLVMIYVGFPSLTTAERLAAQPPIAWDHIRVTAAEAMTRADKPPSTTNLRLEMLNAEPIYRLQDRTGARVTVSARDGRPIVNIDPAEALAIAKHDPRAIMPQIAEEVWRDQWSVTARYDPLRPFYLVRLGDGAGTELYISKRTGEIALDTSTCERIMNWFGAIPHWIYPTILRANASLWRDVILWISGIAIINATIGIVAGLLRLRLRHRYRSSAMTPYHGLMAWHHIGGLIGGITLLTFIVSGWLSMNPNHWFGSRTASPAMLARYAGSSDTSANFQLSEIRRLACNDVVELRFDSLAGHPLIVASCRDGQRMAYLQGASLDEAIRTAAPRLLPDTRLVGYQLLTEEDAYWYSHHNRRMLPVLRIIFDDSDATWFHIDPATGEILGRMDRSARSYRWLFNALHSFDLPVLVRHRPAWDIAMFGLTTSGLLISISGVIIGWRRLTKRRDGIG
jgi:uncharacterized iron-regulated membrane protein